jgi:hypothetical protein
MEYAEDSSTKASGSEKPVVDPAREALVKSWQEKICAAREHPKIKKAFERMRECMKIAAQGSADDVWVENKKYVLPVINRHINLAVSQLYAKHPTTIVKRKDRMLYQVWDGKMDTANLAIQAVQAGDLSQMPVLQDMLAGQQYMMLMDKIAQTMGICWSYFMSEQEHDYKSQIKATVRRTKVNGVAYAELDYQRLMEPNPEVTSGIEDVTSKIKNIELLLEKGQDPEYGPEDKTVEELRLNLQELQQEPELVVREGPVLGFPKSTAVIIDPDCVHLKTLAGAKWTAKEMNKTCDEIKTLWGKDIGSNYKEYVTKEDGKEIKTAKVYRIMDKVNRQELVICEGYCDFLKEPGAPSIKIERFFNLFPLVFNEVESDTELFPLSDVWLTRHPQDEINRSREGIRVHRKANVPFYGMRKGGMETEDKKKLGNHAPHEVIEFNPQSADDDINRIVKKFEHALIDPTQYEIEGHLQDIMRVVGTQEANLGPTSGATATETSIAENSRQSSTSDNVDDLDDWLTAISKSGGQLMLLELTVDTVKEIAGPGAAWPDQQQTREEVARDLLMGIEAGSSGRPNRAAELADMERAAPTIVQIPGIKPEPFAKKYLKLLNIETEDGFVEGLPSITALNAMMGKAMAMQQAGTGDPATDPAAQGDQGANNAPAPQGQALQSQPAFPPPGAGTAPMANQA